MDSSQTDPPAPSQSQLEHDSSTPSPDKKPIHSLVIDAGPIIKNDPSISTLLAQTQELYTIPHVVSEIRDEQTRTRFDTTIRPFLKLRSPRAESIKFVTDFARRTGDLEVLSRPDIHLIALTYELECERNGGDWRLRKTPTQQRVNGKPPGRPDEPGEAEATLSDAQTADGAASELQAGDGIPTAIEAPNEVAPEVAPEENPEVQAAPNEIAAAAAAEIQEVALEAKVKDLSLEPATRIGADFVEEPAHPAGEEVPEEGSDDDSDGWITPSNLKKHQAKDGAAPAPQPIQKLLQAALLTSDFAMQNVALRINLNLLSPSLARIGSVKTWVLRCHGCFSVTRKMDRQFCPSCGQATLTRVSCSTDSSGAFRIHLKRNFQYNKRGNVYSVPKPVHSTSNGKNLGVAGGGQGGWGRQLILAEDQREYVRKTEEEKRMRVRDLMDEDYLPRILTGERNGGPGRIKVGAGRNVNSKRRG